MIEIILAAVVGGAAVYGFKRYLDYRGRAGIRPFEPVPAGILIPQMRIAATTVANIMQEISTMAAPGVDTITLENLATHRLMKLPNAVGYFKDFLTFPNIITASVNSEIINTLPSQRPLSQGDLLKIQFGVNYDRAFAYQAWTYQIASATYQPMIDALEMVLNRAISFAKPGARVRDLSVQIEGGIRASGWYPSREFCGHRMGSVPRSAPSIECIASWNPNQLTRLYPEMLLSVLLLAHEKMPKVRILEDCWNVVDLNGGASIMLSHVIRVTSRGGEILTKPSPDFLGEMLTTEGAEA